MMILAHLDIGEATSASCSNASTRIASLSKPQTWAPAVLPIPVMEFEQDEDLLGLLLVQAEIETQWAIARKKKD